jgi:competence protein ComEA
VSTAPPRWAFRGQLLPSVPAVRLSSRRSDDADVIRARLRALLAESATVQGWLPDDVPEGSPDARDHWSAGARGWEDALVTVPLDEPVETDPEAGLPAGLGRHRAPGRTVRWDPGRRGARSLWVVGLVAALLVAGWTWLDRPQVETVSTEPDGASTTTTAPPTPPVGEVAETSATVVVSVVGQVRRPGLVTLPSGSRVAEAVEAAGGLLPEADPASVNLAAVVTDGQQLAVGVPGAVGGAGPGPGSAAGAGSAAGGRVNLNTAGESELDALPGIGPVLAQRIVDHRSTRGPFTSVEQLDDVPGIGPAIAAELAELVAV